MRRSIVIWFPHTHNWLDRDVCACTWVDVHQQDHNGHASCNYHDAWVFVTSDR